MTAGMRYDQLWRELAACDEIGFASSTTSTPTKAGCRRRPFTAPGAAARTRRLRLDATGHVAPLYDPLRVSASSADNRA
jgi:hypothetical protein